jgi:hypothetical protein
VVRCHAASSILWSWALLSATQVTAVTGQTEPNSAETAATPRRALGGGRSPSPSPYGSPWLTENDVARRNSSRLARLVQAWLM